MRWKRYFLLVAASLVPTLGWADGMVFALRGDASLNRLVHEGEQVAVIVHRNGVQKMLIATNFKLDDPDHALWIFPVPGTPARTKVDVLDSFPIFSGETPGSHAFEGIKAFATVASLTQVWTAVPLACMLTSIADFRPSGSSVAVHGEIEKYGMHAEVITAESLEALSAYLGARGAAIPQNQLNTLSSYLSNEYVLIVAWIASRTELLKEFPGYGERDYFGDRWPCLYVEFPAGRPFYPLRPTSAYGGSSVRVRLYVAGYVKPEADPQLLERVRHYHYLVSDGSGPQKQFAAEFPPGAPYTHIRLEAPAARFTNDLWFSAVEPRGIRYARFLDSLAGHRYTLAIFYILSFGAVAALSYLSAGLTALWFLGKWKGYARFGLWNLLTLYAVHVRIRRGPGEQAADLRKVKFFGRVFSCMFLTLTLLLAGIVAIPFSGEAVLFFFFSFICGLLTVGYRYGTITLSWHEKKR